MVVVVAIVFRLNLCWVSYFVLHFHTNWLLYKNVQKQFSICFIHVLTKKTKSNNHETSIVWWMVHWLRQTISIRNVFNFVNEHEHEQHNSFKRSKFVSSFNDKRSTVLYILLITKVTLAEYERIHQQQQQRQKNIHLQWQIAIPNEKKKTNKQRNSSLVWLYWELLLIFSQNRWCIFIEKESHT